MAGREIRRAREGRKRRTKKRRALSALIVFSLLAILAAVVCAGLSDHLVFTADGVHFIFSKKDDLRDAASVPPQPQTPQREGFHPRAAAAVSVTSNGLPPYGAGAIDAVYLDLEHFGPDEAETVTAQLILRGIRSIVVDIKSDEGRLNYASEAVLSAGIRAPDTRSGKLEALLAQCAAQGVRVCGRISCFRDDILPRQADACGVQTAQGERFEDDEGYAWLDPDNADVREYLRQICAEAAQLGVREIILDHFRFCGDQAGGSADADPGKSARLDALLETLRESVGGDICLSAVIYPEVLGEGGSEEKGQDLERLMSVCDRLFIRCETSDEVGSFRAQAIAHSPQTADMLAVILEDRYVSASLITE